MIKRLLSAWAIAALLSGQVAATQLPYPTVSSGIDTQLPTNQSGLISPPALRGVLHNMLDSVPVTGAIYPGTNSASSYTYQTLDQSSSYTFTAATPAITLQTPVILATTASQIGRGWYAIINAGPSSSVTITPTGSTISANGATAGSSQTLAPGTSAIVSTDGVNYFSTVINPTGGGGGGGGSGTVSPVTMPASASLPSPLAIYTGAPSSSSTTVTGLTTIPRGNLNLPCDTLEAHGGGAGSGISAATNSTAYTAAVTAFGPNGGCIVFGPGIYTFSGSPTITYPVGVYSTSLFGAGPDQTILSFPTGNGPVFVMGTNCQTPNTCTPTFHVRDMSIVTGAAPSGNICLNATFIAPQLTFPPQNDIKNVTCRADINGSRTHGWAFGVNLRGVSFVNIDGVNVYGMGTPSSGAITGGTGTGLSIQGSVSPVNAFAVIFSIANSNFATNAIGMQLGDWFQGIYVNNSSFNFNTFGIVYNISAAGSAGNGALQIANSEFNNYNNNISTSNAGFAGLQISNSLFLLFANSAAVICNNCTNASYTGNVIIGGASSTFGLDFGNGTHNAIVSGNEFTGLTDAVLVNSGVSAISLQGNLYVGNTNNVVNAGSIQAGNCAGISGTCASGATP